MKRYFDDLNGLDRFTLSLDCQPEPTQCQHCSQRHQWAPHGFVYKKQHQGERRAVGKRILCSNRYGRSGCGRTLRFYLLTEIPRLHYTATHLATFVLALLAGSTIQQAYRMATQMTEPRNAYRWLNKLQRKLIDYRAIIHNRMTSVCRFTSTHKQRCILLSTLQSLFSLFGKPACAQYQRQTQAAFV